MAYQIHAIDYFLASARKYPQNVALLDRGMPLTYEALEGRARALAAGVIGKLAGQRRKPVVLALPKDADAVTAILATQWAGHVYVPVDIKVPPERLAKICGQLGDCLIITRRDIGLKLPDGLGSDRCLFLEDLAGTPPCSLPPSREAIDSDPLYVIFTSGSTGIPKGVTVSHRSVIDYIEWARAEYDPEPSDVMMSQAPLYFDNSTLDLYLTWSAGGCLYLPEDRVYMFPVEILEAMRAHAVTTVFWVPSVLTSLANSNLLQQQRVPTLRKILFAGEPMPVPQINAWVKAYPEALFSNLYGPTEITVDCTAYTFRTLCESSTLPIGRPCRNTDVLILSEDNKTCDPDEVGELCVRGSSLALGYWGDPGKSAQVFVQNPLHSDFRDLIYRTGDLVRQDASGLIYFVGRKDSQIKHMGYRIELGEIEAATLQHDAVANACVCYLRERSQIACIAVARPGHDVTAVDLKKFLATKVPRYMVPAVISLMDALPTTPNGKTDRLQVERTFMESLHV